jgi:hypothetical protein
VQFAPGASADYRNWLQGQYALGYTLCDLIDREHDFSDSKTAEVKAIFHSDMYDLKTMQICVTEDAPIGYYIKAADVLKIIERFSKVAKRHTV